jgi:hypothetical protein
MRFGVVVISAFWTWFVLTLDRRSDGCVEDGIQSVGQRPVAVHCFLDGWKLGCGGVESAGRRDLRASGNLQPRLGVPPGQEVAAAGR